MFYHLILGLLRDGRARHGYELVSEYRARSGAQTNPGNFYRELGKLVDSGLLEQGVNPPDADARRIPYLITANGRDEFDHWLALPDTTEQELDSWLLFAHLLVAEQRDRLLDRRQEELWLLGKTLTRAREDSLADSRKNGDAEGHRAAAALLLRRIKQVTAELEFLDEYRRDLAERPPPATKGGAGRKR